MTLLHSVFQMVYCQSGHDISAFCVSNDVLSEWPWHCCILCFKLCTVRVAMTLLHSVSSDVLSEWP